MLNALLELLLDVLAWRVLTHPYIYMYIYYTGIYTSPYVYNTLYHEYTALIRGVSAKYVLEINYCCGAACVHGCHTSETRVNGFSLSTHTYICITCICIYVYREWKVSSSRFILCCNVLLFPYATTVALVVTWRQTDPFPVQTYI